MKKSKTHQSGFTIIEVVLVLAIAGLIFLVVFLALPQLQRSRRDTARRDLVGRVMAALTQDASASGGNYPSNLANFLSFVENDNYFGTCTTTGNPTECESFSDPSQGPISISRTRGAPSTVGDLYYRDSSTCNTSGALVAASGTKQVAVAIALEQGGSFCQDNSD